MPACSSMLTPHLPPADVDTKHCPANVAECIRVGASMRNSALLRRRPRSSLSASAASSQCKAEHGRQEPPLASAMRRRNSLTSNWVCSSNCRSSTSQFRPKVCNAARTCQLGESTFSSLSSARLTCNAFRGSLQIHLARDLVSPSSQLSLDKLSNPSAGNGSPQLQFAPKFLLKV